MKKILLIAPLFISGLLQAQQTVGLFSKSSNTEDGYILMAPTASTTTYLIDKCGKEIHKWAGNYKPGASAYLLEDGSLLRAGLTNNSTFYYAGGGGAIQRYDWNGNLIWDFKVSSSTECQHHDICYLPNGNVLAIVWEMKSDEDAYRAGRDSSIVGSAIWPDKIVEYKPNGKYGATVVWEWHAWDHLVQDRDPMRANYGTLYDNPGKLDINHISGSAQNPDWLHINSVAYNPTTDQILLSCFHFNEIWVIDHSTTTAEAQSSTGGNSGRGGEILNRWGNPQMYGRGTVADRHFFESHDAHWIPDGYPNAGKIIVFNNGAGRPSGNYSSVELLEPPTEPDGSYTLLPNQAYGPIKPDWTYTSSPKPTDFYSSVMAGAQQLLNGNTLICEATTGRLFEVDQTGSMQWEYVNPVGTNGISKQGEVPQQNMVFRVRQYGADYLGLKGKTLVAGLPIEQNPLPYTCNTQAPNSIGTEHAQLAAAVSNPFWNSIKIKAGSQLGKTQALLINALGTLCGQWDVNLKAGQVIDLPVSENLPAGLYLLQLLSDGQQQQRVKLVKQ